MSLRVIVMALAVLLGGSLAWRVWQSDGFQAWWTPPPPPKPFQFDNGTVRQPSAPASGPMVDVSPGLKKCRRGDRIVYTDSWCPEGTQPVAIDRGTVNVVKSPVPPKPAASAAADGKRLPHVRDLMPVSQEPTLRDQHVERTIDRMR